MDYNDVIRYMMNMSKNIPKTAGNKATNAMNKFNSLAQKGGDNLVRPPYNNPRYQAQRIKEFQDKVVRAGRTAKSLGKAAGYVGAGAFMLDNLIDNYRLGKIPKEDRAKYAKAQQEIAKNKFDNALMMGSLGIGGGAKLGGIGLQSIGKVAGRAIPSAALKTEMANAGVSPLISRTIESVPTALNKFGTSAGAVMNRVGDRLLNPMTLMAEHAGVQAGNAIYNWLNGSSEVTNSNQNNNQEGYKDVMKTGDNSKQPTTPQSNVVRTSSGVPGRYYVGSTNGLVNPQAVNQALNNTATVQQPGNTEDSAQYFSIDPGEIYRRYLDKQEALEPYRRGLYNYIRDYHRLSDLSYNQDKYLALLAAQTGATGLNNMLGKYTAIGDEAKALDLQKLYGNEIKNVGEGLDRLQGNIAMAQQMGLPTESVLADDDYVKLALQKEMASDKLENALLRLQMNLDNRNYWNNAKYQLSKARLGNSRGGGRASKGNTIGAYNILSRMIEEGNDPSEATRFVNSNFGTNFTVPPGESSNLYGGRILHR